MGKLLELELALGVVVLSRISRWSLLPCVVFLCVASGCREVESGRIPVHGEVRYPAGADSQNAQLPLNGSVSFIPAEGTTGPSATVELTEGTFSFDTSNGPNDGKHRVIVRLDAPGGKMASMSDSSAGHTTNEWEFPVEVHANETTTLDLTLE